MSTLLTIPEAARYLTISEKSVRRLISTGKLSTVRPTPGKRGLRIRRSELDAHLDGSERRASEKPQKGVRGSFPLLSSGGYRG